MRTVRVYRIEHRRIMGDRRGCGTKYKVGPFALSDKIEDDRLRSDMYAPPGPRDWFNYDAEYLFACPSIEAMLNWFHPHLQAELARIGFMVAVYEVSNDNVLFDDEGIQCAFRFTQARLVKRRAYKGEHTIKQLAA